MPLQHGTPTAATLCAYDAQNFPNLLYSSSQNSADTAGYAIKFTSPVVANGKVYISTGHDLYRVESAGRNRRLRYEVATPPFSFRRRTSQPQGKSLASREAFFLRAGRQRRVPASFRGKFYSGERHPHTETPPWPTTISETGSKRSTKPASSSAFARKSILF